MFSKMIPEGFCTCFGPFWAILGHFWSFLGILRRPERWKMTWNWVKKVQILSQNRQKSSKIDILKNDPWGFLYMFWAICGHFRAFLVIFGDSLEARRRGNDLTWDLKWPRTRWNSFFSMTSLLVLGHVLGIFGHFCASRCVLTSPVFLPAEPRSGEGGLTTRRRRRTPPASRLRRAVVRERPSLRGCERITRRGV